MSDLPCWVIDIVDDSEPICREFSLEEAIFLVQRARGESLQVDTINGGVRITYPDGYRDVILKASLADEWKWKGDSE